MVLGKLEDSLVVTILQIHVSSLLNQQGDSGNLTELKCNLGFISIHLLAGRLFS